MNFIFTFLFPYEIFKGEVMDISFGVPSSVNLKSCLVRFPVESAVIKYSFDDYLKSIVVYS